MARVSYLTAETAPPAVASTVAKMPPLHVFGMLAHAETAYRPWLKHYLGLARIMTALRIDPDDAVGPAGLPATRL